MVFEEQPWLLVPIIIGTVEVWQVIKRLATKALLRTTAQSKKAVSES